jgi:rubrerythrin
MRDKIIISDGPVDTAVVADYERTRRELMRRGLVAGGAVIAASSVPLFLRVTKAFAQADGDAAILEAAVGLEQTAVFAYTAAAGSGKLDPATTKVAKLFAAQEQEHADGLTAALEALGGSAPPKPTGPEDVEGLAEAAAKGQAAIARFAVELETTAVAAYYDAHGKLKDPKLLSTGASIMANEAQHLVVLRQALGANPSPDAFVTGES